MSREATNMNEFNPNPENKIASNLQIMPVAIRLSNNSLSFSQALARHLYQRYSILVDAQLVIAQRYELCRS